MRIPNDLLPAISILLLVCSQPGCVSKNDNTIPASDIRLEAAFPKLPGLGAVVALRQAPGDNSRFYAATQDGYVYEFTNDPAADAVSVFLDIHSRVNFSGESGLLGLDFHPQYPTVEQLFVYYTGYEIINDSSQLATVVLRASRNNASWDFEPVIVVAQPAGNHNGGNILFGPEGYLYIGLGDGGGSNDTYQNGQDTTSLLGSLLRININDARPYRIPVDNPFASHPLCNDPSIIRHSSACPEIYAWGLRNPWRWSFDRNSTADNPILWAGDVGQDALEEVDLIVKGGNYGWNIMEGMHCRGGDPITRCDRTGLILPEIEYRHGAGDRSIVGGYVYRGQDNIRMQFLPGVYLYGDTYSGRIWGLSGVAGNYSNRLLIDSQVTIYSFAEDHRGELYLLALSSAQGANILHITGP